MPEQTTTTGERDLDSDRLPVAKHREHAQRGGAFGMRKCVEKTTFKARVERRACEAAVVQRPATLESQRKTNPFRRAFGTHRPREGYRAFCLQTSQPSAAVRGGLSRRTRNTQTSQIYEGRRVGPLDARACLEKRPGKQRIRAQSSNVERIDP